MPATLISNNHNNIMTDYDWNIIEVVSVVSDDVTLVATYHFNKL